MFVSCRNFLKPNISSIHKEVTMFDSKSSLSFRIGLFIASIAYFSFTFYEATVAVLHNSHPEQPPTGSG